MYITESDKNGLENIKRTVNLKNENLLSSFKPVRLAFFQRKKTQKEVY